MCPFTRRPGLARPALAVLSSLLGALAGAARADVSFVEPRLLPGSVHPQLGAFFGVASGDFDGDGKLDLAATGYGLVHLLSPVEQREYVAVANTASVSAAEADPVRRTTPPRPRPRCRPLRGPGGMAAAAAGRRAAPRRRSPRRCSRAPGSGAGAGPPDEPPIAGRGRSAGGSRRWRVRALTTVAPPPSPSRPLTG